MRKQITLTLRPEVLRRAEVLAQRAGRSVDDWLAEAIELTLCPLGPPSPDEAPPSAWSDAEVLAATDTALSADVDRRLSILLDRQQAGTLADCDRGDLAALMELYQRQLLHKAQGHREAVRRGLRDLLQP
jgi:hypothetical protein